MKKFKILGLLLLVTTLAMGCSNDNADASKIPNEIGAFANKYFPNNKIVKIKEENFGETLKYEIKLKDGTELEFNSKKEIIEIESKTKIPDSFFHANIIDYVATNYPDNFIIEWEHEGNHQEVKLNNGIELEFTWDGDFIKID